MLKRFFNKKIWYIVFIIFLLTILHFTKIINPIENWIIFSLNKVNSSLHSTGVNFNHEIKKDSDKESLNRELEEAKKEINRLLSQQAKLESVYQENEKLQEYLDFFLDHDYEHVLTKATIKDNLLASGNSEYSINLDKGLNQGIEEGMAVINEEGVLIGKIISVKDESSKACLSIDKNCKFAAGIFNKENTTGITSGKLGLTVDMDFIPKNYNIAIGDIVSSSGLEDKIPEGLLIGRVSRVDKPSNEIWQKAVLEPLYDVNQIKIVSVIIN
ncbi:rod shape-determining protein MreC [bacterium]|nr:rod shape-determining protein MreC [bacterium]